MEIKTRNGVLLGIAYYGLGIIYFALGILKGIGVGFMQLISDSLYIGLGLIALGVLMFLSYAVLRKRLQASETSITALEQRLNHRLDDIDKKFTVQNTAVTTVNQELDKRATITWCEGKFNHLDKYRGEHHARLLEIESTLKTETKSKR